MRRLTILAVAAFSLSNLLGCEDGPKQTYEPSPPSAADTFNDGCTGVDSTDPNKCPRVVDTPSKGTYDEPDGGFGNNAQEICTGPEKKDIWGKMIRLSVEPPRYAAGLDMAGDNTWKGLTIEQAEQGYVFSPELLDGVSLDNKQVGCNDQTQRCVRPGTATDTYEQIINPGDNWKLCQSDAGGYTFGQNSWGDGGEVDVSYYVGTRIITALSINPGYKGSMVTKSRDGEHTYIFPVTGAGSAQITKDGQPLALDWTNATDSASVIEEIYDSMIATYAPALPPENPGVSCATTGHCIIGNFGAPYYMFVPSIGFGFVVATIQAGPVVASSPFNFQIYKTKLLAF